MFLVESAQQDVRGEFIVDQEFCTYSDALAAFEKQAHPKFTTMESVVELFLDGTCLKHGPALSKAEALKKGARAGWL